MSKLNKTFMILGILLLTGGILLIVFPKVMKYLFSIVSVAVGAVLFILGWNGRKAG